MRTEHQPLEERGGGITTRVSSSVEATLPLPVSMKWVAYACRMAGVSKPRWNRHTSQWTATGKGLGSMEETIVIRQGATPKSIMIEVSWDGPLGSPADTSTGRRLITAFFTGMQWAVRQRATA